MVRKVTPTAGGWSKRSALPNQHRKFEQSASRTLLALPTNAPDWRDTTIQKLIEPLARRPLSPTILAAFRRAIVELVDLETPALPEPTAGPRTTIGAVSFRARLRSLLTFRNHADLLLRDWSGTISHILRQVAAALPEMRSDAIASNLTVPLIDLAPAPVDLVADIVSRLLRFAQDDPLAVVPGTVIAHRVKEALLSTSKITEDIAHKNPNRIISPKQSGLTGEALVAAFLGDSPLADLLYLPVPFVISRKTWASHGICIAPPNFGKSQWAGAHIAQLMPDTGIWFLDPHGDTFDVARSRVPPERLVVINPDETPRPSLNFLDFGKSTEIQQLQTFAYLMDSLSDGLSSKQSAIVPYLLKLLRQIPKASLETLRLIVDEKVKRPENSQFAPFIAQLPLVDQGFFHNQYFTGEMQRTKDAVSWRIYSALASDAFREMFSTTEATQIDFDAILRDQKVVLVKGARNSLGDAGMRIFLQYILAQYFAAGMRRESIAPEKRKLNVMFADEAHTILSTPIVSSVLVELRKYQCGFVGLTQLFEQISPDVRAAVLGATAIKCCGAVSFSDANVLSREMHTTPDFIRSMKAVERSHADWAFYVSGMTDKAVRVTVPYGLLEAIPTYQRSSLPVNQASNAGSGAGSSGNASDGQTATKATTETHESKKENAPTTPAMVAPIDKPIAPQSTDDDDEPLIKPGKDW